MPDYTFHVFQKVDIGGTDGLTFAGMMTVRDDDGFRDGILDDIEQAGSSETNGDQEIIASAVTGLAAGNTLRSRGIFEFTNNVTGETYAVTEIFSQTAGNPIEQFFIFTSTAPDWLFDGTSRSFALSNSDGTLPYSSIVCFGAGTAIEMGEGGCVRVEDLKVGDRVLTRDGSAKTVRWIGSREVAPYGLLVNPKLRPVRIKAGALGRNLPSQDLIVSRQHRVLVTSAIAKRVFGVDDVLVPAIKLVGLDGIDIAEDIQEVEYFHILFDHHEIIYSNGIPTESLFTGPEALKAVSPEARAEITELFPEISAPDFSPRSAALIPRRAKDVNRLVARHSKNAKPLLASA